MIEAHWTDRLSEYLDGELDPRERAAADLHLAACPDCAGVLADLRTVVASAALLPDAPPERDLWPEIRARFQPRTPRPAEHGSVIPLAWRRRVVLSVPQLIAAGLALMLFSAAGMWAALSVSQPDLSPATAAAAPTPPDVVFAAYEPGMADLEAEYQRLREQLDPETIRVVEWNLAIIDVAIQEARDALAMDPSSGFLHGHLAETVRRRMSLLREVASI
jgi:hypothetical protein